MTIRVPRLPHRIGRPVEGASCACTPDRIGLFHYDPGRQTCEGTRAGVHEP